MIFIDFETRSRVNIKKAGAWRYAQDPSTQVLCMAYAIGDGPVELWTPGKPLSAKIKYFLKPPFNAKVEAHNAFFEKAIWRNIMVKQYGWPNIPDKQWRCSAAKAAAHALPRPLDQVGDALNLKVQKNQDGKQIMLKLARPRKPTEKNPSEWFEDPEDYQKLYEYCKDDVRAERALDHRLRDLIDSEQEIWFLDQKINERGIRVDIQAVKCAIAHASRYVKDIIKEFKELTSGKVEKPTQRDKFVAWIRSQGVKIEGLTKAQVVECLEKPLPLKVKRALEIRQLSAKTSVAKYLAVQEAVCEDERLRGLLVYFGASTGRWAGRIVQPHNFPKNDYDGDFEQFFTILKQNDFDSFEMCFPDVLKTLSSCIRGLFIPSEGKTFFGGDYLAIEARIVMWLAGEEKALQMFSAGKDLYQELAGVIYNKKPEDVTKDERFTGKQAFLGCGFRMGWERFQGTCAQFGQRVSEELAKKAVKTYRDTFVGVVDLWDSQEKAAMLALEKKQIIRQDGMTWAYHKGFLYCKLPSGRCLAYYSPRIEPVETPWGQMKDSITYMTMGSDEPGAPRRWHRTSTHGGKIVENVVQALARDLMVYGMFCCEDAGYEVVMTIHDELLSENDQGSVSEFEGLMSKKPKWAKGLPVAVEGWEGKRYLK